MSALTEKERLWTQYDAATMGECGLHLYERHRPGAVETLQEWARAKSLQVIERDCRPAAPFISHMVELPPWRTVITVYATAEEQG